MQFPEIGALLPPAAKTAITKPAADQDVEVDEDAFGSDS